MQGEEKVFDRIRLYFILAAVMVATPTLLGLYTGNTGKLLVATDKMDNDPYFKQKVVYVFDNDFWGARGVVVNNPMVDLSPDKYDIYHKNANMYNGGPVAYPNIKIVSLKRAMGISRWRTQPLTMVNYNGVDDRYPSYSSKDANLDVYIGYTGWSMGQLEKEIKSGVWKVVDCNIIDIREKVGISKMWQYLSKKNSCLE